MTLPSAQEKDHYLLADIEEAISFQAWPNLQKQSVLGLQWSKWSA